MNLSDFYRSKAWEKLIKVLKQDPSRMDEMGNLVCWYCGKPIVKKYDAIGHHVEHLTEENVNDSNVALNPDNIKFVHHRCHNRIHEKGFGQPRQVFLVYGSPCSGKTSFVNESKVRGDLILDVDSIWQCVSGCEKYEKPNQLKAIVFGIRDKLIDDIRFRRGSWKNAYIIGGYPLEIERNKLLNILGARPIHIDTSEEECLERLMKTEDGRDKTAWKEFINSYWSQVRGEW